MKFIKLLLVSILVVCVAACGGNKEAAADAYDAAGHAINLKDYHGKWLVINYWAEWCPPCVKEMPELEALYQAHKDDVEVLGVNYDGKQPSDLKSFISEHGITFPIIQRLSLAKLGVSSVDSLPVTFVIDPNGVLQTELMEPQTQASLEKLMGLEKQQQGAAA